MTLMASAVFIHLHRHADRITRRAGEDPQGAAPCRGLATPPLPGEGQRHASTENLPAHQGAVHPVRVDAGWEAVAIAHHHGCFAQSPGGLHPMARGLGALGGGGLPLTAHGYRVVGGERLQQWLSRQRRHQGYGQCHSDNTTALGGRFVCTPPWPQPHPYGLGAR